MWRRADIGALGFGREIKLTPEHDGKSHRERDGEPNREHDGEPNRERDGEPNRERDGLMRAIGEAKFFARRRTETI
jgi:hypothetical protein